MNALAQLLTIGYQSGLRRLQRSAEAEEQGITSSLELTSVTTRFSCCRLQDNLPKFKTEMPDALKTASCVCRELYENELKVKVFSPCSSCVRLLIT